MNPLAKSHTTGFLLSLFLTLAAYILVVKNLITPTTLIITLAFLALTQATVQLFFFLHIGQERKPHWKLTVFFFMAIVAVVIVFGSLWIMNNLNYNLMPKHKEADVYY